MATDPIPRDQTYPVPVVRSATRWWRPGWPCSPADILWPVRRGAGDPAYRLLADGSVLRATRTPDGPAALRMLAHPSTAEVELEAWGPGTDWALMQAPALLGAEDDVGGFAPRDERVREAWVRNPHWRVMRSARVLEALTAAAIEQKVTGREAWLGWRRLLTRFGDPAPGLAADLGMHCPPTAAQLLAIPSWEWLRCHIDGARSRTIVAAARVADSLERTVGLPADEVDRRLRSLPGVGRWTSAEVRQRAHGDADAVSFGDYHVAKHIGFALTGSPIDDTALADLLEPERPHRYRVQHVVTTRMRGLPRRGPRLAPRAHLPA